MTKDVSDVEAVALATIGFPLTIHRTISERGGDVVAIHVGDKSVEDPSITARKVLSEYSLGLLPQTHPMMDAVAALNARHRLQLWLAGKIGQQTIGPDIPGRFLVTDRLGRSPDISPSRIETPDLFMATTLSMMGFDPLGIKDGNPCLFQIARMNQFGEDGAKILCSIRDGTMPANHPAMTWYLACSNWSHVMNAKRNCAAMIMLSRPGMTRDGKMLHAYIREDSPGFVHDKVKRFFGYK